jgi:hypothetical protein
MPAVGQVSAPASRTRSVSVFTSCLPQKKMPTSTYRPVGI